MGNEQGKKERLTCFCALCTEKSKHNYSTFYAKKYWQKKKKKMLAKLMKYEILTEKKKTNACKTNEKCLVFKSLLNYSNCSIYQSFL